MEALYSKYRPKVFGDVVGQKHILQTLQNAVDKDKISHAYMFCGPRGTGKTTMARLLAKACMCKNSSDAKIPSVSFCGKCKDCTEIATGVHPDVYELDAASRTGVENVREEIIGRVGFAATRGNKKIYIIDEVHMLSTAAFNALLKTLEEPPEHVIFILCTTDPQKVPETILSRCQRFNFNAISADDILERLKFVCVQENVSAQDEALQVIAKDAQGAMRNALTNLEQVIAFTNGQVTLQNIQETMSSEQQIDYSVLIECLGLRNLPSAFDWIEQISNTGVDFSNILRSLTQIYRDMYVKSADGNYVTLDEKIEAQMSLYSADRLHRILIILNDLETQMKTSTNLRLSFEIACAKIANPKGDLTMESLAERVANLELVATAGDLSPAYAIEASATQVAPKPAVEAVPEPAIEQKVEEESVLVAEPSFIAKHMDQNQKIEDEDEEEEVPRKVVKVVKEKHLESETELQKHWHSAFSKIKNKYPAFGATLLTATPSFDGLTNQFILNFPGSASFSVGVLKKPDSMEKIHAEIREVMGEDIGFNIVIDEEKDQSFNPKFENNFRNQESSEVSEVADDDVFPDTPDVTLEEATDRSSITDMLNDMGAYNITEE